MWSWSIHDRGIFFSNFWSRMSNALELVQKVHSHHTMPCAVVQCLLCRLPLHIQPKLFVAYNSFVAGSVQNLQPLHHSTVNVGIAVQSTQDKVNFYLKINDRQKQWICRRRRVKMLKFLHKNIMWQTAIQPAKYSAKMHIQQQQYAVDELMARGLLAYKHCNVLLLPLLLLLLLLLLCMVMMTVEPTQLCCGCVHACNYCYIYSHIPYT